MPVVRVETMIQAPVERCFDLARDPDMHVQSTAWSGERVVSRTGGGLLQLGDEVTFEAVHLGVRQRLTARITRLDYPRLFEDQQVRGAFQEFRHLHTFDAVNGGTLMTDLFAYRAPFGPIGRIVSRVLLTAYLNRFLIRRAAFLKQMAEVAP